MEAELLKALLQAVRENNSELKAIRRLLEAQNREGLVMPESPNPQNSQETEIWNNEVDRLCRGELG